MNPTYFGPPSSPIPFKIREQVSVRKAKIANFWYKFAPNGYIPLTDFLNKILRGEGGVPGPYRHAKFHRCGFKNVAHSPQNSIQRSANRFGEITSVVVRSKSRSVIIVSGLMFYLRHVTGGGCDSVIL